MGIARYVSDKVMEFADHDLESVTKSGLPLWLGCGMNATPTRGEGRGAKRWFSNRWARIRKGKFMREGIGPKPEGDTCTFKSWFYSSNYNSKYSKNYLCALDFEYASIVDLRYWVVIRIVEVGIYLDV
jgi:hypothetical protein